MVTAALLSQDMEMSIDRGMDKEDVVHKCNGILLSHRRNGIMPSVAIWMGLEAITQSEVSQKEKEISQNVAHMWNLEKCHR